MQFEMLYRLIPLLLACIIPIRAQTAPDSPKDKGKPEVKLLAEQFPPELGKVYLLFGKTQSKAFELPTNRLSEPITVDAREMSLKLEGRDTVLCQLKLPDTGRSFAIVLVTAKPSGFEPIIVRTDDPAFRAGDVVFINRSAKTVLGKLGTSPLVLKPGESRKSRPTGAIDNTYYDVAFAIREGDVDKLISSSRWPVDEDLRSYLFFFTNAEGRTTFRSVDEYLKH